MEIKISVLASGETLLNGEAAALSAIQEALQKADPKVDIVLYYRETPWANPPPQALQVMNLIGVQKLRIFLSAKPDFSDYKDQSDQTHPRSASAGSTPAGNIEPAMPEVELWRNIEQVFAQARKSAAGDGNVTAVVIVRPDRSLLLFPASSKSAQPPAKLPDLIPSGRSCNIVAISNTGFPVGEAGPGVLDASQAIPFLGFLFGWAWAGHRVWVFEGHPSALAAGLKESEFLLVDSGMLPFLQPDWMAVARRTMQPGSKIFLHDRAKYQLHLLAASTKPPGWRISEPDGEASYANCLLTTMAKGGAQSVELVPGEAVPDLSALTNNPDELEWIAGLPFRYDLLDAQKVIGILLNAVTKGKVDPSQKEWVLNTKVVAKNHEPRMQKFVFRREQKWFKTILQVTKT